MAVTLPVTCASTAAIATDAVCPTAIEARSLSTTSAVTSNVAASMTIASPVGASRPLATLTVVTMPAIGEVSVASLIWVARSARVLSADDSWVSALLTPILAWRIRAVTSASFGVGQARLGCPQADPGGVDRGVRVGQLALEIRGVGGREDLAGLDGVAHLDLEVRDRPRRRSGVRRGPREMGGCPEGDAVGRARRDRAGRRDVVRDVAGRRRTGQVLGGGGGRRSAGRRPRRRWHRCRRRPVRRWPGSSVS